MNRARIRAIKNLPYPEFEKAVNAAFDDEMNRVSRHCYNFAWAAMLTAIHERYGADRNELQRIAARTVDIRNNALCAEECAADLKAATGFDIDQPPSTYEYD